MKGDFEMTAEEEMFNLQYRPGGGFPKEHENGRDLVTDMLQAKANTGMLWNAMAGMGCQCVRSERIATGCGGLDYHA